MPDHDAVAQLELLNKNVGLLIQRSPGNASFVQSFSFSNGDSLWRFTLNSGFNIKDEKVSGEKCYLLTDSVLYVIGNKGDAISNTRFSRDFKPVNLILRDSIIFIVGEKQIGAWKLSANNSISFLWEKHTGNLYGLSLARENVVWFLGDNDSLMVVNIRTGEIVHSIRVPYNEIKGNTVYDEIGTRGNYLFLKSRSELGILKIDSLIE